MKTRKVKKKHIVYSILLYWWLVAAIYFYVGWGTGLGNRISSVDLILVLGIVTGLSETYILETIVARFWGVIVREKPDRKAVGKNVVMRLTAVLRSIIILWIVTLLYAGINRVIISLASLSADAIPFPGEPITFSILYMLVRSLWELVYLKVKKVRGELRIEVV